MNDRFDVVIAGLGAMGSAALFHLARRGVSVLGLDQFAPPHAHGSSHGETRVIREAYFEHPDYVPLIQRAFELWSELEQVSGEHLYLRTGGLMIGHESSAVLSGALQSARAHRLPHEFLSAEQIRSQFPGLQPDLDMFGVLEKRAGILFPEACVAAHLQAAQRAGAQMRVNEKLHEWSDEPTGIVVRTAHATYHTRKLILAGGAWIPQLVPGLRHLFKVERQVLLWFKARDPDLFHADVFPIHLWEYEKDRMFYGFPDLGSGVKIALHHGGEMTNPISANREVQSSDVDVVRPLLERFLPEASGPFLRGTVCLYTNTPDGHFVIDRLPTADNVIVASPCSGHGFKFASAIGEALADLATDQKPRADLTLFRLQRFDSM